MDDQFDVEARRLKCTLADTKTMITIMMMMMMMTKGHAIRKSLGSGSGWFFVVVTPDEPDKAFCLYGSTRTVGYLT